MNSPTSNHLNPFPLSPAQRGIWLAQQLDPSVPVSVAQYVEIHGEVDRARLNSAFSQAGSEFESLELRIVEVDTQPLQWVDESLDLTVDYLDLRREPDPEASAHAWMRTETTTPIDLQRDPMATSCLLHVGLDHYFWYWRTHHIALDGLGSLNMLNRIAELYMGGDGLPPPIKRPLGVRDIHELEIGYGHSARREADRKYWTETMRGFSHSCTLARGRAPATAGSRDVSGLLPDDIVDQLDKFTAAHEGNLATLVVAALSGYLARMTGEDDITLSLPVSGRTTAALRRSGGMVANMVPLRIAASGTTSVGDLVSRTRLAISGALRHQRYRIEDIRADLRDSPTEPRLFGPAVNIMLPSRDLELGSVTAHLHVLSSGPIEDLLVNLYRDGPREPISLDFKANPRLYSQDELEQHHCRFLRYLRQFLRADSSHPIGDLPVLTTGEASALVPFTGHPGDAGVTLAELLRRSAKHNPDSVAVVCTGQEITYRELDERSDLLAAMLISAEVGPDDIVALAFSRSIDYVCSVWAVAKSGAAFLPVDPSYPRPRVQHMLDGSRASVGLTTEEFLPNLPTTIDWLPANGSTASDPPSVATQIDQIAYLIYTSGSTGVPKGVAVTHRGIANLVAEQRDRFGIDEASRVLHAASPGFDASVLEMLMAFGSGATLVIAPPTTYGGWPLSHLMTTERVTHAFITPSVLASIEPSEVEGLRTLVVGGESCPRDLLSRWTSQCTVINAYGPAESTVVATVSDPLDASKPVTIGRPIRGARAVVLDQRLRPVPSGVVGELYVAGAPLARGYHHRARDTSARFIADPYGPPGTRMYRTGDTVRWTPEYQLHYLGRSDDQVNLRGVRIEPGEIDATLCRHPAVRFAVTLVRERGAYPQLTSYVVGNGDVDEEELLAFLGAELPSHMVPASVIALPEVPLTPSGKLDRNALLDKGFRSSKQRSPGNERERLLHDIYAEVLGSGDFGVDDSFFALGGDSIMAIQLASRARTVGISFTPRDVFEQRTISRLCGVAEDGIDIPLLEELPGGGIGDIPLTPAAAFLLDSVRDIDRYAQAVQLELPPGIDAAGLCEVVTVLLGHHDALRTHLFRHSDGRAFLSASGSAPAAADLIRRIPVNTKITDAELAHCARNEFEAAVRRLDPVAGVMLQCVWLDTGSSDTARRGRLLIVAHHLVIDGVSWRILISDLAVAWPQIEARSYPVTLAAVGTSLRRWSYGLIEEAQRPNRRSEMTFWREVVGVDDPPLGTRPLDTERDTNATVDRIVVKLPAAVTHSLLRDVPASLHCEINDALLTALGLALTKWQRRRGRSTTAPLIRLEGHGREESVLPGADLSRTIGWFTSIFPVRLDLSGIDLAEAFAGGPAASSAISSVKEQLRAVPDKGIGYGLLRYLGEDTANELRERPDGQISFNYLGRLDAAVAEGNWRPVQDETAVFSSTDPSMPVTALIDVTAFTSSGTLDTTFAFAADAIPAKDIRDLADLWVQALTALTKRTLTPPPGGLSPSDLPLVSVDRSDIEKWERRHSDLLDVWPLTPLQAGLLYHAELTGNDPDPYVIQVILGLSGKIDRERLRRSCCAVLAAHANLRTAFVRDRRGVPAQLVLDDPPLRWRHENLSGPDPDADAEQILLEDRSTAFDLAAPPPLRFTLLTHGQDRAELAITSHHIAVDGWSIPLLMRELFTAYRDGHVRRESPSSSPYRDFLVWLSTRDTRESARVWAEALDGITAPAPPTQNTGYTSEAELDLSAETTRTLAAHAADLGVTLSTLVQLAWGIVLGHATGRDEVVIGATVSGRPAELTGVESAVGLFVNTVPVRIPLDLDVDAATLLTRLQARHVQLLEHHYLGLAEIQEAVGVAPLFDTLVAFESYPVDLTGLAGSVDGLVPDGVRAHDASHYSVTLSAKTCRTLELTVKCRSGEYEGTALLARMGRVLEGIARDPHRPIGALDLLGTEERERVLRTWNATDAPVPRDTLPDRFAAQVRRTPTATAVVSGVERLTYAEFDSRVNRLARYLVARGIGPETVVGVSIPRSLHLLVALYAVMKAGGAYLPVDAEHPLGRTSQLVDTVHPALLLASGAEPRATPEGVPVVDLDVLDATAFESGPLTDADRRVPLRPTNAAYVLYTSGSTGRPKCVTVTHEMMVNQFRWAQKQIPLDSSDVVLHKTPLTFDISVWELLWPLETGARVVLAGPDDNRDPGTLANIVEQEAITTFHVVPSLLDAYIEQCGQGTPATLRRVISAGELLTTVTATRFRDISQADLHNWYGPCEVAASTAESFDTADHAATVPIGRPVDNIRTYVLDTRLRPVPPGATGELYLASAYVARCYSGRSELTAASFVADPFGGKGGRMYRTGDSVRWDGDGRIHYIGRFDFQIKRRDQRIEPGEIEAALKSDPEVKEAAVTMHRDPRAGDRLIAYIVPASGAAADSEEITERLTDRLPAYMIPSAIVHLAALPVTSSGKLDRASLPKPPSARSDSDSVMRPVEDVISFVFAEVTGTPHVARDLNFFAAGGNSLTASQAVARLGSALGIPLEIRELFDHPTVAGLSEYLAMRGRGTDSIPLVARVPIEHVPLSGAQPEHVPLSPAQQRLWFLNRLDGDTSADNIPIMLSLKGTLDESALCAAVGDVIERHEPLRTVYPEHDGIPYQHVLPASAVSPCRITKTVDPAGVIHELNSTGFDLTVDPPILTALLAVGEDEWVLVLVIHHISVDGFSLRPLARDILAAYTSRTTGTEPSWAPLPVRYADYARWQQDLRGRPGSPALSYWTQALSGLPEVLPLPCDRPRPRVATHHGAHVTFSLDADSHQKIRELALTHDATPFMVVHAALAVLATRLSGIHDIAVGTPISGRGPRKLDDLVGMFVNTLVLRTDTPLHTSFAEVVAHARSVDLASYSHADVAFEDVVESLSPTRALSHNPLFQLALSFHNPVPIAIDFPDMSARILEVDTHTAKFDLQLTVTESFDAAGDPAPLSCVFTYATDLFDEATVRGFADRFQRILETVLDNPDVVIGDIELLCPEEKDVEVGHRSPPSLPPRTLPELLSEAVRHDPDATALRAEGRSVTYRDLDLESNQLARALIRRGIGPESVAALGLPRSILSVLSIWAVAKTGAAFVPVDPHYPLHRIEYLLDDSGAVLGLTTRSDREVMPNAVDWIMLDDPGFRSECRGYSSAEITDSDRVQRLHTQNPAYVIYTSGSTGRPKGVVATHAGLANFTTEQRERYSVTASSRILLASSPSFDGTMLELLMALGAGACAVLTPPTVYGDDQLADVLVAERVTHMFTTPTVLATIDPAGLHALLVVVGGEPCPPRLVADWAAQEHISLFIAYGPTETTIVTSISDPMEPGEVVTIGRPVRGSTIVLLDPRLHPVPPGVAGELYIRGPGVARGYHRRSGLTGERFVACPFGTAGERMYRTGDVGRRRPDGSIEYLYRNDAQVELRGVRIELGEIDATLLEHPSVRFAATDLRVLHTGADALVSYVVPAQDATVDPEQIIRYVAAYLPAPLVPTTVVVVDTVPLTANGKLDLAALPDPEPTTVPFHAPRTPTEQVVATVFAQVIGTDLVGREDNFFSLGGTSLSATRAVSRIGAALGATVPVRTLFDAPTVSTLAEAVAEQAQDAAPVALTVRPRPARIPLSPAQQRLWFLARLAPRSPEYNIAMALRLSGSLDVAALGAALGDVVRRHEPLRTQYPEHDGVAYQQITPAPRAVPRLTPIPVSHDEVAARVTACATTGFTLSDELPIRARLFALSHTEWVLAMTVHHISADGYSMGILAGDLMQAYAARLSGQAPHWQPLPVQYTDYTLWQLDFLGEREDSDSIVAQQLSYWKKMLEGAPEQLSLPTDRPRPAVASHRGANVESTLDDDVWCAIERTASANSVTAFMVVHAAFAVLLAKLSGSTDIVIGTPVAGRGDQALDELVGMFVNNLALRTEVVPGESFSNLLSRIRESDLDAFAHSTVPFETVVEVLDPSRSRARNPLFQVALAFQNLDHTPLTLPGLEVRELTPSIKSARVDLQLTVVVGPHPPAERAGMSLVFTYATDLFDHDTVAAIADRFVSTLSEAVAQPDLPVGDIAVLERILPPPVVAPTGLTLVDLFDRQVAASPDATATVQGGCELRYRELDRTVNRLARHLIGIGVGPESIVGLAVRHGIDLLIGMYAVAKTGAAYMPMDPDHPVHRNAELIQASGTHVVLTTERDRHEISDGVPSGVLLVVLDSVDVSGLDSSPVTDLDRIAPLRAQNPAYVMYTSGSTGAPKGVVVTHASVVNFLNWRQRTDPIGPEDTVLMKLQYTFDASARELWWPLVAGARLVIAPADSQRDPLRLAELIGRHRVSVGYFLPLMLAEILTVPDTDLTSLRQVSCGGETLPRDTAHAFRTRCPDALLYNEYGPTESTVAVTRSVVDTSDGTVPIGLPMCGVGVLVLDARLHPSPVGVPGELYLAGAQLARGYLGQPGTTAARFVANPWGSSGERMYRTGDVVSRRRDGTLDYLGRNDLQVKIRGQRVELGEIEAAMRAHRDVAQSAAAVHQSPVAGARLVGYVVPRPDVVIDTRLLSAELARSLPRYMVPNQIAVVEALPSTPHGKLDRRALPDPGIPRTQPFRPPTTCIEKMVTSAFEEILGAGPVGLDDNFFELGGNSLSAVKAASRLHTTTDVAVRLEWFFDDPTVEAIAARISSNEQGPEAASALDTLLPLSRGDEREPLFCIHPAIGLSWCYSGLHAHLDPGRPVYGLQSPALTAPDERFTSITDRAHRYVEEIRRVQPQGPYHLLGYSVGGVIAHAMAVELRSLGEEVSMLAMIDSYATAQRDNPLPSALELLAEFDGDLARQLDPEHLKRLYEDYVDVIDAAVGYAPGWFDGGLLFFSATRDESQPVPASETWRPWIGGELIDHTVNYPHRHMTDPEALAVLGPVLASALVSR
ncbi:amino acid adenylation domain-containing protein [Rhodococcus sp. NPDC049939]|uniref:non-ribosomal peptide synthetase n=1 Tax=Rhodococcus sp. NPDC049939 TaxID=3155511 RepID=UPI0033FB684F